MPRLLTWQERVAAVLDNPPNEGGEEIPEKIASAIVKKPQTPDSLRVDMRTEEYANDPQTPSWLDSPRLVRTGPNTWVEAEWCRGLCVNCDEPLAEGDVIACAEHRRQLDALLMPWETKTDD